MASAFGHRAELPGGRAPFWLKDDGLAELGLRAGDAVGVDSSVAQVDGDLVLAEVTVGGVDLGPVVRRYFEGSGFVTLRAENRAVEDLCVPADEVFIVGVVKTKVRFLDAGAEGVRVVEEPIE